MKYQQFLVKFTALMGAYACTTPARHPQSADSIKFDDTKSRLSAHPFGGQFDSDPTLRANLSPLRISNRTCRENQSYILKQAPKNQIEFGIYQNFSFNKLSFNSSGFFAGYRCEPQP